MERKDFRNIFRKHDLTSELCALLNTPGEKIHLKGLVGSSRSILTSLLSEEIQKTFVICLNDKEEAAYFYDDLNTLASEVEVLFFPSSYKRSVHYETIEQENIILRTEVLNKLKDDKQLLIVTYSEALVEKVISGEGLASHTFLVKQGDKLSIEFVNEVLFEYGFERVDFVYEPGQYSIRGSIVDIYSFSNEDPYRLDFFGDEVDTIRSFNIENQISKEALAKISIIPNIQEDLKGEERISFLDFIPADARLFLNGIQLISDQMEYNFKQTIDKAETEDERKIWFDKLLSGKEFAKEISRFTCAEFGQKIYFRHSKVVVFETVHQPVFHKNFDLLAENLIDYQNFGFTNYILSGNVSQTDRLQAIFDDKGLDVKFRPVNFTLHEGFIDRDLKICCYTDHEIFERYHRFEIKSRKAERDSITFKELNKLHQGDYVVHVDHGIGKFAGLVKTEVDGKLQEAIRLTYRDNDVLLVSIHNLHRISKYKGKEGTEPNISKLGSGVWQKLKERTKLKVKDIAKDLIELYAARRQETGFAFSPDSYLQNELEASFIYEDTPDQVKSTIAVKEDMEKEVPMDRLVCGDVGFGKTEIAVRAAFKAVADSKQVAILVPTTILALQHFKTFTERLRDFPARVEYISRLRKPADVKQVLVDTKAGKVDILIGTHKLVGKQVVFKDLGLLIVDEEQKFGVSVKEKLKQMKLNIDTLTLTATPIPRTLQFSMMGARDLSIIQTPPPNRYPIATELHEFNEDIIREAIQYEMAREGQTFFIHNRVSNIYEVEAVIRKIVPGVRTVVGHGQMEGAKLEKLMMDFINGEFDVLIATTIIESGLDIPNANTIIINHAQNFGLSDLHQLRGRVGRSNKKAFCYLLAPPLSVLTPEARRRLKAIEEFSELGSGFNIAMQDLDIRGAGNLLGAEQSGFIADIGFETYHRILNEAIQELKQTDFKELFKDEKEDSSQAFLKVNYAGDCQIDTDLQLLFPDRYIQSTSERMLLYRELDNLENEEALALFETGLVDRFGQLPPESIELIEVVRLRWAAVKLGMEKIILKKHKMICHFVSNPQSSFYQSPAFGQMLQYVQAHPQSCRMKEGNNKLSLIFEKVKNVKKATEVLVGVGAE
ncbi:MAG TPA: transcription-repair coupling factor [Prolixibacteraceae bacterium]|nr:transcription-repair coupling factor [Prolixibacteraceae bacterium]